MQKIKLGVIQLIEISASANLIS